MPKTYGIISIVALKNNNTSGLSSSYRKKKSISEFNRLAVIFKLLPINLFFHIVIQ